MKEFFTIAGIGAGLYGLYLIMAAGDRECRGKNKRSRVRRYLKQAENSLDGVRGNGQARVKEVPIIPDNWRQAYDARPVSTCCPSVGFPNFMYPDGDLDNAAAAVAQ